MEETVVRGSKFYRSISYNCQQDLRGRSNELYVSPCNLVSDFSANLRVFEISLTRNFDKDIVQSEPAGAKPENIHWCHSSKFEGGIVYC